MLYFCVLPEGATCGWMGHRWTVCAPRHARWVSFPVFHPHKLVINFLHDWQYLLNSSQIMLFNLSLRTPPNTAIYIINVTNEDEIWWHCQCTFESLRTHIHLGNRVYHSKAGPYHFGNEVRYPVHFNRFKPDTPDWYPYLYLCRKHRRKLSNCLPSTVARNFLYWLGRRLGWSIPVQYTVWRRGKV